MKRRTSFSIDEDALLLKLRDGERRKWSWIAEVFPKRSQSTLQQRYYAIRGVKVPAAPVFRSNVKPGLQVQQASAPARMSRAVPSSRLVLDAELRARIELQGPTAGLFGDPPPGRSALDEKLAGHVHLARVDRRVDRQAGCPKPTLPQGIWPK